MHKCDEGLKGDMKLLNQRDAEYAEFRPSLNRRAIPDTSVSEIVSGILSDVKERGDAALIELTARFDKAELTSESLLVSEAEIAEARASVSEATKAAIASTRDNIHLFTEQSKRQDWSYTNKEGATVGERFTPFDRVGIYVPGGKAPLVSTALMTGAFAQAIGCPEIVAATPCGPDGKVNPELLYALVEAGATQILKVGGAQGIAALGLGTESVAPVEKIFGPGNIFVVEAKRQLVGAVSIDLIPGPSEILVIADETGNPAFLAADLLGQAEHGPDSEIGFVTTSAELFTAVQAEIEKQLPALSRGQYLKEVLESKCFALLVEDLSEAVAICNDYAPEHLTLVVQAEEEILPLIRNAGAIYVGNYSAVAVGDFLAGPSHTLPTGGAGKSFSGLRADQFQRRQSIVRMDRDAVANSLATVQEFSRIEGLDAHGESVAIRVR